LKFGFEWTRGRKNVRLSTENSPYVRISETVTDMAKVIGVPYALSDEIEIIDPG